MDAKEILRKYLRCPGCGGGHIRPAKGIYGWYWECLEALASKGTQCFFIQTTGYDSPEEALMAWHDNQVPIEDGS